MSVGELEASELDFIPKCALTSKTNVTGAFWGKIKVAVAALRQHRLLSRWKQQNKKTSLLSSSLSSCQMSAHSIILAAVGKTFWGHLSHCPAWNPAWRDDHWCCSQPAELGSPPTWESKRVRKDVVYEGPVVGGTTSSSSCVHQTWR